MNYAANVSGGANTHYPVAGENVACSNPFTTIGGILVLFILLVIITRAFVVY